LEREQGKIDTASAIKTVHAIENELVFLLNDNGNLLTIDKNNGAVLSSAKFDGDADITGMAFDNKNIYLACGRSVYHLIK
jgi:hypothetical protein